MQTIIVGTAGHIDHGKTALIKALNGFEGDENKDEKERGITINLSFSNLASGENNIAFIDVPGHENLVKTMISGAYGFDACMLVVSSDDGLMPQSKEHIAILSLLNVKSVILCITKCDLVDTARQNEVKKECENFIANFENLQILNSFFLSTKDNDSITELKNYLFTLNPKKRSEEGIFHYYIDRVFSLSGAGTIVTGSLINGKISKNEKIYNCDLDKVIGVKNIQIHDQNTEFATAPNRVALNLSGIEKSALKTGQILTKKGYFRGFNSIDCKFYGEISHNDSVLFCVGSKQISAKCLILRDLSESNYAKFDNEFSKKANLDLSKTKIVTFKFEKPVFVKFGEPFVVLKNSRLIGGGSVLNAVSEPLKKEPKLLFLKALLNGDFLGAFKILSAFHKHGFGLYSAYQRFDITSQKALEIARNLKGVFLDEENFCVYDLKAISDIKDFIKFVISKNNLAVFSGNSIALKLTWASENLANFALNELEKEGIIAKFGGVYIKSGINFDELSQNLENRIFDILQKGGITPLAPYNIYDELEIDRLSGDNAMKKLTKAKKIIRLEHNLFVTAFNLDLAIKKLYEIVAKNGFVDVLSIKEELNISRKFAICYLEYLDKFDNIERIENKRFLKK